MYQYMKVYSPSDIAELLDVKPATLRKYSIMLEDKGYKIQRNSQNHRYYLDKDIITLRRIITARKSGITLEEAINGIVRIEDDSTYTNAINNANEQDSNDIQELKEIVHKQNELLEQVITRLDEQQKYIDGSLKERDKALMQTMNDILESKKQIETADKEENKKSFFARLFSKED